MLIVIYDSSLEDPLFSLISFGIVIDYTNLSLYSNSVILTITTPPLLDSQSIRIKLELMMYIQIIISITLENYHIIGIELF